MEEFVVESRVISLGVMFVRRIFPLTEMDFH